MRRKGQAPFSRRAVSSKIASKNSNVEKKYARNNVDGDGDFLYDAMHHVVADGMNHITQSIMQGRQSGNNTRETFEGPDGDLIDQDGELQTHAREDIPMQPLTRSNENDIVTNTRRFGDLQYTGSQRFVNTNIILIQ